MSATPAGLAAAQTKVRKQRTWWQVLIKQRLALAGLIIITFFLLMALIGPHFAPYTPTEMDPANSRQAPSAAHWFGTDEFGRDIFTRLLYGARISFQVGVISVGIAATIGILLGMVAGYFGGWLDSIISLLMDVLFAFPTILLAIALMTALGDGITNVMIAIGLVNAPAFMRVVRGSVLSVRNTTYVESAVSVGASSSTILSRHVFPNVTAPLIVHSSLNFATAVLAEASLAYLSLGNKPPSPSWGSMVSTGYTILQIAPWAALFPGLAIGLTVLGFNLLGDGLRDALDPRLRNQG
ncbi:MAG: ABC transporter permease [Thermomicrobiales bacterium]|nr:ABC transporter permease [Thermomicrobiales bacterium]MCO5217941.1 ABC transporter permease [Thermomicrobiales bacterium]MCO5224223.1 ABC transporter permease [Thermomicrobiales bacterium]MCO5228882.1 ABC transporter permease [Thermomicrobiales bacterium]